MSTVKFTNFIDRQKAQLIHQVPKSLGRTALISITDPTYMARLYEKAWEDIIRLQFHDIDRVPTGAMPDSYTLFNEVHAKRIMDFLAKNQDRVDTFLVHCEAGISRSAAVSKFIAYIYNLQFPESYQLYNKHVFRTMFELYNKTLYSDAPPDFTLPGLVDQGEKP